LEKGQSTEPIVAIADDHPIKYALWNAHSSDSIITVAENFLK
jgi:hypothetical protein